MPSIDINFINCVTLGDISYTNFIETGTWRGETIFGVEPYFENLFSIECKKELYDNVIKLNTSSKIKLFLGDSSKNLVDIFNYVNGNAIIFLDGHYSGGDTGMGKLGVPLYQELDQIINNFKYSAIIIIDDFRLFGYNKEGWDIINLKTVIEICKSRLIKKYNLESSMDPEDRLILHIKSL